MLFLFIIGMLLILLALLAVRGTKCTSSGEAKEAVVVANSDAEKVVFVVSNSSSLNKYYSDRLLTREGFVGISSNRASSTGYELDNIWYPRW